MSLDIKLKLLTILPKLMAIGLRRFNKLLEEFPEAKTRSTTLKLYDDKGNTLMLWAGFEGGRPVIREVDPSRPPYSTTVIEMHVDTFIKILKGELDFRTAYLYDLIDVRSNDGLPAAYHVLLWSAFFDLVSDTLYPQRRRGE